MHHPSPPASPLVSRLLAASFAIAAMLSPSLAAAREVATAVEASGQVTGTLATQRRSISAGNRLEENERITTGQGARSAIRLDDGTNLSMGERAEVILDRMVYDPDRGRGQTLVNVTRGGLRFVTGRMRSEDYSLTTPTTTIGVRGTEFSVLVEPNGQTTTVLHTGMITVTNRDGATVTIDTPGHATIVPPALPGQPAPPPRPPAPAAQVIQGGPGAIDRATGYRHAQGAAADQANQPAGSLNGQQQNGAGRNGQQGQSGSTSTNPSGVAVGPSGDAPPTPPVAPTAPTMTPSAPPPAPTTTPPTAPTPPAPPVPPASSPSQRRTDRFGNTITETALGDTLFRDIRPSGSGSPVTITQVGDQHAALATPGRNSPTYIEQRGQAQNAVITGGRDIGGSLPGEALSLVQTGESNNADLRMGTSGIKVNARQDGTGHGLTVRGSDNTSGAMTLTQGGMRNILDLSVTGSGAVSVNIDQR